MSKHLNQSRMAVMPACFLVVLWMSVMALHANPEGEVENNVWTCVDGRKIQAQGVAWSPRGVLVKKQNLKDTMLVPYGSLQADDVSRAVNSLPFDPHEDVTLKVPVAQKIQKIEKGPGRTVDRSVLIPQEKGGYERVEKTRVRYTYTNLEGYDLEVQLKSNSDPCEVWVEVYGFYLNEERKKMYSCHRERLKVELGSEVKNFKFSCPPRQSFDGWVVLCRSQYTGKIAALASSSWQFDSHARKELKEPGKWHVERRPGFTKLMPMQMKAPDEYREKILEDLKLRKTE